MERAQGMNTFTPFARKREKELFFCCHKSWSAEAGLGFWRPRSFELDYHGAWDVLGGVQAYQVPYCFGRIVWAYDMGSAVIETAKQVSRLSLASWKLYNSDSVVALPKRTKESLYILIDN